jgi:thioredoxin reductase (NADPH)
VSQTLSKELVVVGGGVAGCTAAMYAKRYNLDLILLEKLAPGGQAATASHIENYPGFPDGISGLELAERVHQQATNVGVEFVIGAAESLERDGDAWIIHSPSGDVRTLAVIIATGASPRRLKIPGERELFGAGVSYCATCDGMLYRNQDVAVVGGGNTAVDEAIYLADICRQVYLIHRRDELRAESYLQERAFARPNLEIVWDSVPAEVLGNAGAGVTGVRVRNVKTEETRDLPLTGLFVAIGHEPQTAWVQSVVQTQDGFIPTDAHMATNAEGIFAAGDIRDTPLRQITTAVGDASIAAYSTWQYVMRRR